MLCYRDTCRVINKTRLNPCTSRLAEVLQGATDCHGFCNDTRHRTRSNPYGVRLEGGFAGDTQLFHVSAGNGGVDTDTDTVTQEKPRVMRSIAHCIDCVTVTELPDLLPRRRNVAGEVVPESGKSGQAAAIVKAEGKHPSEKPLLTLTLTEEQLRDLAFAVYCQVCEIQDGDEADHPEVVPVIRRLNEVSAMCIELAKLPHGSCATGEAVSTGVPLAIRPEGVCPLRGDTAGIGGLS